MHFWVSAARPGLYGQGCWPRKMGTNWFMPAFVKRRFGLSGMRLEEGTMVCCFDLKKSRNDWRISLLVITVPRGARWDTGSSPFMGITPHPVPLPRRGEGMMALAG